MQHRSVPARVCKQVPLSGYAAERQHRAFHLVAAAGSEDAMGCTRSPVQQHRRMLTVQVFGWCLCKEHFRMRSPLSGQPRFEAGSRSAAE